MNVLSLAYEHVGFEIVGLYIDGIKTRIVPAVSREEDRVRLSFHRASSAILRSNGNTN